MKTNRARMILRDYAGCMRSMEKDWDNGQPDGPERMMVEAVEAILEENHSLIKRTEKLEEIVTRIPALSVNVAGIPENGNSYIAEVKAEAHTLATDAIHSALSQQQDTEEGAEA